MELLPQRVAIVRFVEYTIYGAGVKNPDCNKSGRANILSLIEGDLSHDTR